MMMAQVVVLSSDRDDVFEPSPPRTAVRNRRGRNHGDVDVDAADRVPVVATVVAPVATETCLQVFYFSQKMFDYMCTHGTSERIDQARITQASDRKGVLLKRKESHTRTKNLVDWAAANEAKKPGGKELAELRRKRHRTKKNTDNVMGRNKDAGKVRRCELSQLSQTEDASQQNSQQQSQTDRSIGTKRPRKLYSKYSVPASAAQQALVDSSDSSDSAEMAEKVKIVSLPSFAINSPLNSNLMPMIVCRLTTNSAFRKLISKCTAIF